MIGCELQRPLHEALDHPLVRWIRLRDPRVDVATRVATVQIMNGLRTELL